MSVLGFPNEKFQKVVWFAFGGTGNGDSAASPKAIASADLFSIPAGTIIEKAYIIIDVAITGTTALTLGDDDAAAGYLPDQAANLATPGMYGWDAKTAGSYLRISTAGATDAGDIYVVPAAKYYAAAGKEVKLVNTTTNTAGAFRIVVEGSLLTK